MMKDNDFTIANILGWIGMFILACGLIDLAVDILARQFLKDVEQQNQNIFSEKIGNVLSIGFIWKGGRVV